MECIRDPNFDAWMEMVVCHGYVDCVNTFVRHV
jgi:hypothetical protein